MSEVTAERKTNGQAKLVGQLAPEGVGQHITGREALALEGEGLVFSIGLSGAPTGEWRVAADARYDPNLASRYFGIALRLLREADTHVSQALASAREDDPIAADDAVYAVKPIMQELFLCRAIGDGFALIVSGLLTVFRNLEGEPLNQQQLRAVAAAIIKLRAEPLLSVQAADNTIEQLEKAGLNPDLSGLEDLVASVMPNE